MKQMTEDQTETGAKLKYSPIPQCNNAIPNLKSSNLKMKVYTDFKFATTLLHLDAHP